jgi:hypothetical protein
MKVGGGRVLATVAVAALGIGNYGVQHQYTSNSAKNNQQYEVMLDRLASLDRVDTETPVMLDVLDPGMENVAAVFTRHRPTANFLAENFVGVLPINGRRNSALTMFFEQVPFLPFSRYYSEITDAGMAVIKAYHRFWFSLSPIVDHEFARFAFANISETARPVLVTAAGNQSVVNNSSVRPKEGRYYLEHLDEVRNHLAEVGSTLGHGITPGLVDRVALWQREPDNVRPGGGMQAMGRHLLFEVINPAPGSRILLDVTSGPLGKTDIELSHARVIGDGGGELGIVGRGATRVLSEPIVPRAIGGHFYLALDMGAEPRKFPYERSGITALYNRDLNPDPRSIVGFARNISLLTEEEVRAMSPPPAIEHFPADLFSPGLLFSGVYEDGWMAEAAKFRLGADRPTNSVRISAEVPGLNRFAAGAMIEVLVDGRYIDRRRLEPGDLALQLPIDAAAGPRWVELRVDTTERLPIPDGRIASIRLKSIAVEGR